MVFEARVHMLICRLPDSVLVGKPYDGTPFITFSSKQRALATYCPRWILGSGVDGHVSVSIVQYSVLGSK